MIRTAACVAYLFVVAGFSGAAELAPLPEGDTGIASGFVMDGGIGKHPSVIFASGFENGFSGWSRHPKTSEIVKGDAAHSGGACAVTTATKGKDSGGDIVLKLPKPLEKIHLRFYCKLDKDSVIPHHFVKLRAYRPNFGIGGHAGRAPAGDKAFWTGIEPTKKRTWLFYTYWHKMRSYESPDGRGNKKYGNTFHPENQKPFEKGTWICVEAMMKCNTPGEFDGEKAFWIDGKKIGHWRKGEPVGTWIRDKFVTYGPYNKRPAPFEGFNFRTTKEVMFREIALQWYVSGKVASKGTSDKNICSFDDVVVATEYIGPQVKRAVKGSDTTKGAASAPAPAPAGGGRGIAAKYPLDRGIASDPAVIFFDGFEKENWKEPWYKNNVRWRLNGVDRASGEGEAFTGASSLKLVVPPGKTYGSTLGSGKLKPGWDTMHMRFYAKYSENYRGGKLATITALDPKIWVPGASGKRPTGTDKANAMICPQKDGGLQMYYYNLDQRGVWGAAGRPNVGAAPKISNGEWHCFEIQGTMNAPGKKNAVQKLWVDGRLVGEWTGFRWRSAESLKWNSWCFLIGANKKAQAEQYVLIDNIVVASRYIGPIVKEAPRAASRSAGAGPIQPKLSGADRKKAQAESAAGRILTMARQAERMGQRDVAKALYRQIVDKHPGTEIAKAARAKLE